MSDSRESDLVGRKRGKTLRIDRQFPIGRIQRMSGTAHEPTFCAINSMLDVLWETGRVDILERIQLPLGVPGRLHPLEVYSLYRRQELHKLPAPPTAEELKATRLLDPTLFDWAKEHPRAKDKHKQNLKNNFARLLSYAAPDATVADLPDLVKLFQRKQAHKARMCNVVRTAVQAYLRAEFGRRHPLYKEVQDIPPLEYRPKPGNPVSPDTLTDITDKIAQPRRGMLWSLALTGMRPGEYWEERGATWEEEKDRILVHGTKTPASDRVIPKFGTVIQPGCTSKVLLNTLQEVRPDMVVYDMRRTFSHWLEHAGIPESRVKIYMGHGPKSVTGRYQLHNTEPFFEGDVELVSQYLEGAHAKSKARPA